MAVAISPPDDFEFDVTIPDVVNQSPVLVLSLSARIDHSRVYDVLGHDVDIWEVSTPIDFQHNDFIRAPEQLSKFRVTMRKLLEKISAQYGLDVRLKVFPAMPVSCSVELGRVRMPKASMPWEIFDQNYSTKVFEPTITIQGGK